jgi:hypothetical protein
MYPTLFTTRTAFTTATSDFIYLLDDRVQEMIDIVRDATDKDIRRAFPSIHHAVEKVQLRFHETPLHHTVAKTVAVLQILDNLPVTLQNVASLLHPSIDAPSQFDAVKAAAEALIAGSVCAVRRARRPAMPLQ